PALLASKGTVTFVDLVARFNRRDLAGHLMDMVPGHPEKEASIRAARQVLAFGEGKRIEEALKKPKRAPDFVKTLGFVGTNESTALLRAVATDPSRSVTARLLAIAALGRSSPGASALVHLVRQKGLPGEFLPSAIRSLASSPGPGTRLFAAQQQELLAPAARRWPLEKLLAARADAARGKGLFQKARCNTCHIVRGEGTDFGPELSDIGTKLTSPQLFAAILNPSQTISLGYEGVTIGLKNGTVLSGFVTSESETSLGLRIQGGLLKDLFKADIRTRKAMGLSLMPAAIDATLAPQDLVDLVGWLKTLRNNEANK
ncbi:MAG: c-type cytochrome, partial [Planctomycetota bacterium]|nr:c-type cytochrome [Planctomycetota bacterium]